MNARRLTPLFAAALALATGALTGCSKDGGGTRVSNLRPEVRLTNAPVSTEDRYFYAYRLNWVGHDPDGRIDHFEYAIDPPTTTNAETTWTSTTNNEQIVFFRASNPEDIDSAEPVGTDFHTFVIRAIDDLGARSAPVHRSFFSYTVAPTVQIETPRPSRFLQALVTPSVTITWSGRDPDGQFTQKPVKYKYKMFRVTPEEFRAYGQDPDSLRRQYAPHFFGWDSTSADTTFAQFTNLTPSTEGDPSTYLFALVGFDEAGAYSPVFSLDTNVLQMNVGFAGSLGPKIGFFNEFFFYLYSSGGYSTDESKKVRIEVPCGTPTQINWFAIPDQGSEIRRFRWAVDIEDLTDNTPRTNENTDLKHWSQWGLSNTSARVPAFPCGNDSGWTLYVEAEDINGLVSLGMVAASVVTPTFDKDLAIIDDTRFLSDQRVQGTLDSVRAPSGAWPSAAEFDTFMYARGGVRWKSTPSPQQMSPPGVFRGYRFDTIGTREGRENPTIPLARLGQYRNVIWLLDGLSSTYGPEANSPALIFPEPALRYMTKPNRQNTLATYILRGGNVWLMGGGVGNATLTVLNRAANDEAGIRTYSATGTLPELIPGRMMYDLVGWKTEFKTGTIGPLAFHRTDQPGTISNNGGLPWVGAPQGTGWRNWPGQPDYTLLPTTLDYKTPATDPIYPMRSTGVFYRQVNEFEWLSEPTFIEEDPDNDPATPNSFSALDTLYWVDSSWDRLNQGMSINPVMTVYHGLITPSPVIFTGFNAWVMRRDHFIQIVDFVLQTMWGLPHDGSSRVVAPPTAARRPRE
jgi:hypothetical protein